MRADAMGLRHSWSALVILALAVLNGASNAVSASAMSLAQSAPNPTPSIATISNNADKPSLPEYSGGAQSQALIVTGNVPDHLADKYSGVDDDNPGHSDGEQSGQENNSDAGESSGAPETDPIKVYIGDTALAEDGELPENLCQTSTNDETIHRGCASVRNYGCGDNSMILSYETGDGVGRSRCVNADDLETALEELGNDQEESLPAEAYTAFTDLSLEPAVVKFEPDLLGFGYKSRHTNMYADVETQTVSQELLGQTVQIRAIPQEFHWDYGDGTSRTTFEPGGPLPDYDGTGQKIVKTDFETVTSHVYEETGIYPVTVETVYTGQFRVGDGEWRDIPGTVAVESSPGEADIWTQNSRWVSGACESTEQWGCNGPIEFDPATDRPPKIYQDQYDENGRWLGPVE